MSRMNGGDPERYWQRRLSEDCNLHGVGYRGLGRNYNRWLYRVRAQAFKRHVVPLLVDHSDARVLDLGAGTGFYIEQWRAAGVRDIVGVDFAEVAVEHLRSSYPEHRFVQADIGANLPEVIDGPFDIVSAFDVLFHITDDDKYRAAIENVYRLLKVGGAFVLSENFLHGPRRAAPHQVSRPLSDTISILEQTGFQVGRRVPMFCIMNAPVDSENRILRGYWRILATAVRSSEAVGYAVGAVLFPLELLLTKAFAEGPSTEILLCHKQQ
jgi:SAM-dependent methyltransferase